MRGSVRALVLSLLALAIPVAAAFWFPRELEAFEALLWLLALVPAFLFAFQRGWWGAATALAVGMAVLSVTYAGTQAAGKAVPGTLFVVVGVFIAVTLGLGWFGQELKRNREAAHQPGRLLDDETQLPTWIYAERYLEGEFEAALRGRPLAVVLFGLREVRLGSRGEVSRESESAFAEVLRRNTRTMNISARREGGQRGQFLSVLTETELKGASIFAHRVLSAHRAAPLSDRVTMSAGVAVYRSGMRQKDQLLAAAETALREAQEAGGDRVRALGTILRSESGSEAQEDGAAIGLETTPESRTHRALVVGPTDRLAGLPAALERRGLEVAAVDTALAAVDRLHHGYDLAVVDVSDEASVELIRTVQMRGGFTQVLAVTGPASLVAGLNAMNAGAARCLVQPVDDEEVDAAITMLLERRDRMLSASLERTHITGELTARQRAVERTLTETEARYRAVVDGMREVVFQIDADGRWQFLNDAWENLGGTRVRSSLGRPFSEVFHPDDRSGIEAQLQEVLQGNADRFDAQVRLDGEMETRWVSVTGAPAWEGETPVGVYGTIVDVTDRRYLEEQLRHAQKMEAIGQLAGGIAHDFNNLLMAIRGHAEFVLEGTDLDDAAARDLRTIVEGTERATGLTRQLLAFGRKHVPNLKVLDLDAVVVDMEGMLHRLLGEDIDIVIKTVGRGLAIEGDEAQVQQIVLNLAMNGRDAMPGGGRLTLHLDEVTVPEAEIERWGTAAEPGTFVRLTVRDTGMGMDEATAEKIFEPFFTTKAVGKGTGLGLSTVYGIVRQAGGHIEVDSRVGEGSVFRVLLPRADGVVRPEGAAPEPGEPGKGSGEAVLVVEDEKAVRSVVRRFLERSGYVVHEAATAAEALETLERLGVDAIDLLMTDVVMPGMSGVELAEEIHRSRPGFPVLFMSGYAEDEMVQRGHSMEGSFLKKPFQREELLAAVEAILRLPARPDR